MSEKWETVGAKKKHRNKKPKNASSDGATAAKPINMVKSEMSSALKQSITASKSKGGGLEKPGANGTFSAVPTHWGSSALVEKKEKKEKYTAKGRKAKKEPTESVTTSQSLESLLQGYSLEEAKDELLAIKTRYEDAPNAWPASVLDLLASRVAPHSKTFLVSASEPLDFLPTKTRNALVEFLQEKQISTLVRKQFASAVLLQSGIAMQLMLQLIGCAWPNETRGVLCDVLVTKHNLKLVSLGIAAISPKSAKSISKLGELWIRQLMPFLTNSSQLESEFIHLALDSLVADLSIVAPISDVKLSQKSAKFLLSDANFDASLFASVSALFSPFPETFESVFEACSSATKQTVALPTAWRMLSNEQCVLRLEKIANLDTAAFINILLFGSKEKSRKVSKETLNRLIKMSENVSVDKEERKLLNEATGKIRADISEKGLSVASKVILSSLLIVAATAYYVTQVH